jgi:hypothetical protein
MSLTHNDIPKEKLQIITAGEKDCTAFFTKSDNFCRSKLAHTPFLAFLNEQVGDKITVTVQIVDNVPDLLKLPDSTQIMSQWQGQWRSEFFQFTVGEYKKFRG